MIVVQCVSAVRCSLRMQWLQIHAGRGALLGDSNIKKGIKVNDTISKIVSNFW